MSDSLLTYQRCDVSNTIHVLSLGAGVQSSTMALMAARGELIPMPVAAIFADTHAEPASVYRWLEWLEKQLPFPVLRVSKGDLTADALKLHARKGGGDPWIKSIIPSFIKNPDGSGGLLSRACTRDYKVSPIIKNTRRLMRERGATQAVSWIGISLDEAIRMKPSREKRIINRWPLIEKEMKRYQCLDWMAANGYPKPPRSACVYCPFHSDSEWRRLRNEEPQEWGRAVKFDADLREAHKFANNLRGVPFVHSKLVPLDKVDLSTDVDNGQSLLWGNECEGMCGV